MGKAANTVTIVTTAWEDVNTDELLRDLRSQEVQLATTAADVIEVLLMDVQLYKAMAEDESWWDRLKRWWRSEGNK